MAATEYCPDPTCAIDFWASKGIGWSHDAANNEFDCDGSMPGFPPGLTTTLSVYNLPTDDSNVNIGGTFRTEFTVRNYVSGTIWFEIAAEDGTVRSANGTYIEDITDPGGRRYGFWGITGDGDFVGSITNIHIQLYSELYGCDTESDVGRLRLLTGLCRGSEVELFTNEELEQVLSISDDDIDMAAAAVMASKAARRAESTCSLSLGKQDLDVDRCTSTEQMIKTRKQFFDK